jgi:hypothetical protein
MQSPPQTHAHRQARGLLILALLGWLRFACRADASPPELREVGQPVSLALEGLAGDEFRLLPGVGPTLAARLEAARVAAGGRLDERGADAVSGVGPSLLARWREAARRR